MTALALTWTLSSEILQNLFDTCLLMINHQYICITIGIVVNSEWLSLIQDSMTTGVFPIKERLWKQSGSAESAEGKAG